MQAFFSVYPIRADTVDERGCTEECPIFTVKEPQEPVLPIKNKKSPELDGIPSEVLELVSI